MMFNKRNGTLNNKRLQKDLLEPSFKIDERPFSEVVGYMVSFLEKINYFNLQNEPDGNWRKLVEHDPIIFLVLISNEPFEVGKIRGERKRLEGLKKWYLKLEEWYRALLQKGETQMAHTINNALENVLSYHFDQINKKLGESIEFDDGIDSSGSDFNPAENFTTDGAVHVFEKVLQFIQESARKHVEEHIAEAIHLDDHLNKNEDIHALERHSHQPHNAMYIAFALLFKKVQNQLNSYTSKHLDFYYKQILRQNKKEGIPSKITACFNLLPTVSNELIPKGTVLKASKLFGSENEVEFETSRDLLAQQVELVQMHNFLLNKNPYIKTGTKSPLVSSVTTNKLIEKGKLVGNLDQREIFGSNEIHKYDSKIRHDKIADLGFIIGSPILHLSEGQRDVKLTFYFEKKSANGVTWKLLDEIATAKAWSLEQTCYQVFSEAFLISHTNKKGWVAFNDYRVTCDISNSTFSIYVSLSNIDAALEPSKVVADSIFQASIKVMLNPFASTYAYSFFSEVELDKIDIDVSVKELKNLSIYNNIGKMALGKPFDLFGPLPAHGGYLMLGKAELFNKKLKQVHVDIDWQPLPKDFGGFETYFNLYDGDIKNNSFQVKSNILSQGYWVPRIEDAPSHCLFETTPVLTPEGYQSEVLKNSTRITLNELDSIPAVNDAMLKDPLQYTINSLNGFIKLTLTNPIGAFGIDQYQELYTEIALYNAKKEKDLPLPKPPYVPKVSAIQLAYTASDTLFVKETITKSRVNEPLWEFHHIRPFGTKNIFNEDHALQDYQLFPNFDMQSNVFMEFEGITDQITLTLFFHFLRSDSTIAIDTSELFWSYFDGIEWKPLGQENILSDGTSGFLRTGIIELRLPSVPVIQKQPAEMYRLKVAIEKNAEHYPKLQGVYVNAVEAVCLSKDSAVIGKQISAFSVQKTEKKLPGIKDISQPAASYGGLTPETDDQYYARVSERIRHKDRAVSIWDYERLVLSNFNEIRIVKSTNLNREFQPVPGKVTVAVLGTRWTNEKEYFIKKTTLDFISKFLKARSNGFHTIEVRNPEVEYLLVNCNVTFNGNSNQTYYKEKLNKDIISFLSPISSSHEDINGMGSRISTTMITGFIENIDYVKKVNSLFVEHIVKDGEDHYVLDVYKDMDELKGKGKSRNKSELRGTTPWSVLVPVLQHLISAEGEDEVVNDAAIGTMEIGSDLIVSKEETFPLRLKRPDQKLKKKALLIFKNK